MLRAVALVMVALAASCAPVPADRSAHVPPRSGSTQPTPAVPRYSEAQAAGFLREIDPLGGYWRLLAFDGPPLPATRRALLQGHEGAFLSTSGDCTSSSTSYVRDGAKLEVLQHIPPETGKCTDGAAAVVDRALARAVASARSWAIDPAGRLHLDGAGGGGAVFARPIPRRPELHGRWLVESIGGKPFAGNVEFGDEAVSARIDCNTLVGQATFGPGSFTLHDRVQTLIGCGKEREAADGILFEALGGTHRWRIDSDGALRIDGAAPIVARRPAPMRFSLPGRYQVCNNSTLPLISHDGEVWIEFTAQSVRDQAGCSAAYTTAGAGLRLTLSEAPACRTPPLPPTGVAQIGGLQRSPLAQFQPDGFAWDSEGRLHLRTPRGLLALCPYMPAES